MREWLHINGHWVTGVQESISVFAPDATNDENEKEHEIPLDQPAPMDLSLLKMLMTTWLGIQNAVL